MASKKNWGFYKVFNLFRALNIELKVLDVDQMAVNCRCDEPGVDVLNSWQRVETFFVDFINFLYII